MDYEPPGFRPSRDPMIIIPDNELWRMKEVKVGQMDSGFHKYEISSHTEHKNTINFTIELD